MWGFTGTAHSPPLPSPTLGGLETQILWTEKGEAFLFTVGAFLLIVKLLCLQSLKALIRRKLQL